MDQIEDFSDDRNKSWCIHCRKFIEELDCNRDHAPSKSLLRKPYPANLPVVKVCKACNEGFSKDEQYGVAFLGSVLSGSTEPSLQLNPRVADILRRNAILKDRIERSKSEYQTADAEHRIYWIPELERINRVIVKNARGHAFFELGEPMMDEPELVWSMPLEQLSPQERAMFEDVELPSGWPEVGSRMMTRLATGQDLEDAWVIVQDGVYRYAVWQDGGVRVRSIIWEYLATEVVWEAS